MLCKNLYSLHFTKKIVLHLQNSNLPSHNFACKLNILISMKNRNYCQLWTGHFHELIDFFPQKKIWISLELVSLYVTVFCFVCFFHMWITFTTCGNSWALLPLSFMTLSVIYPLNFSYGFMSKQDWTKCPKQICVEEQSFCIQIWLNFTDVYKSVSTGSTSSYESKMLSTHWWNISARLFLRIITEGFENSFLFWPFFWWKWCVLQAA